MLTVDPSPFVYQCPLCPWTVRAVADPERGAHQPERDAIRQHLLACKAKRKAAAAKRPRRAR